MNKSITAELAANWRTITLFVLLILTLTGCGPTKIPVQVERPSTLNTTGIKRIAVMPFEADNPAYTGLASYATSAVADRVRETNRFTLVDASEVQRLQRSNQSVENYVDAMFIGRITRAVYDNDAKTTAGWTDKKGRYYPPVTTYYTKVEVEFSYSLKMARDGRLIGPISRKGVGSASSGDGYPSAEGLLRNALNSQIALIGQDIAPYKSTELRTFAEDKTGVSTVKTEMKEAMAHVKTQNYKIALESYLGIYERYKSPAAAENASILYEALGDMESALKIMQRVYDDTGNPTAQLVIARLNKNLEDKAKVAASEQEDTRQPVDKVTAFANEEIQKVLPSEAVVWFYNNSPGNTMVEAIVDNLTADFIRKGIGIVDRQNTALVEAEQKLQVSGSVNDAEMVKIGNAAGAKAIVIIGIAGSGAVRRLQVRVLDIERNVPIMQSDTDERWQL
jgi:tetratricopeptide (TPR) repeat protein